MKKLNICFITQKYDEDDPYRANVVEWIKKISSNIKVENIHVLTRYKANINPNSNFTFSNIESPYKLFSLFLFYLEILKQIPRKSIIFIHMGGPYAINLFIFKLIFNIKVYQWWAHPILSLSTKLGFYLTINKLFTCTENSFPIKNKKKVIVGHGININRFPLRKNPKPLNNYLVTASRLTFRKNIHKMINIVQFMLENDSLDINLDIYGSPLTFKDELYKEYLKELIKKGNLENNIKIFEAVSHSELNTYYENYNVYLNFSETALDKSVLEAMSTGIPVLSCNDCLREIINDDNLKDLITFDRFDNLNIISSKIKNLINLPSDEFDKYSKRSSQFIKYNHSIESLANNIIDNIFNDIV